MVEREGHEQQTDNGAFERITPAAVESPDSGAEHARKPSDSKTLPAATVVAGLVVLLLLAAGVFVWLGQRPEPRVAPSDVAVAEGRAQQKQAKTKTREAAPDADTVLARRQRATSLEQELADKRQTLAEQAVQRWAPEAYARTGKQARLGDRRFARHDYTGAIAAYRQGIKGANQLLKQAPKVLEKALARGRKALAQRNVEAAVAAFDLALAVDEDNPRAQKGARRAASLDQVLALMATGRAHENAGELEAARKAYAKAHELDPAFAPASKALERVEALLAQRRFSARMSEGLAALERGDYAAARDAFIDARDLRPGSQAVADGLARARAGLQRERIAGLREQARTAAANEHWQAAVAAYEQILSIDQSLQFARAGRKQAAARAELADKLRYHLAHLSRLTDASVRNNVAALLDRARAVPEPGPQLRGRIARLAKQLQQASEPVPVMLYSNNQTRVSVFHVGHLGRFQSKRLTLTPGHYTAIGRCKGYRDVRLEFTVVAGQPVGPIRIVCTDKL